MGSSHFYLEFLIAWLTRLMEKGCRNPACFALEYTLVPDAKWPTQLNETRAGYQFLQDTFGPGSAGNICISGDSAGATLVLSMLLHPGGIDKDAQVMKKLDRPGLAVLLSPWTHLVSDLNRNTRSDYLNKDSLHLYARQYAGDAASTDEVISPGLCADRWKQVAPKNGFRIIYGAEEVFAPGIEEMTARIKRNGVLIKTYREDAGIHAWPVVNLFLGGSREERLSGLDIMAESIMSSNMAPQLKR
jgi:acetyl esterase/lipase